MLLKAIKCPHRESRAINPKDFSNVEFILLRKSYTKAVHTATARELAGTILKDPVKPRTSKNKKCFISLMVSRNQNFHDVFSEKHEEWGLWRTAIPFWTQQYFIVFSWPWQRGFHRACPLHSQRKVRVNVWQSTVVVICMDEYVHPEEFARKGTGPYVRNRSKLRMANQGTENEQSMFHIHPRNQSGFEISWMLIFHSHSCEGELENICKIKPQTVMCTCAVGFDCTLAYSGHDLEQILSHYYARYIPMLDVYRDKRSKCLRCSLDTLTQLRSSKIHRVFTLSNNWKRAALSDSFACFRSQRTTTMVWNGWLPYVACEIIAQDQRNLLDKRLLQL